MKLPKPKDAIQKPRDSSCDEEGLFGDRCFDEQLFVKPTPVASTPAPVVGNSKYLDYRGARPLLRRSPRKHIRGDARLATDSLREHDGSASNRPASSHHVDSSRDIPTEHANLEGHELLRYLRSSPVKLTRQQCRSMTIPLMWEEIYGGDAPETISTPKVSGFREIFSVS